MKTGPSTSVRRRHGPTVDDVQQDVEQQQEAGAAGVDHPGVLEDGEQVRRAGEGVGALGLGRPEHGDEVGTVVRGGGPRPRTPRAPR